LSDFEKRRAGVEKMLYTVSRQQLASGLVALAASLVSTQCGLSDSCPQSGGKLTVVSITRARLRVVQIEVRRQDG